MMKCYAGDPRDSQVLRDAPGVLYAFEFYLDGILSEKVGCWQTFWSADGFDNRIQKPIVDAPEGESQILVVTDRGEYQAKLFSFRDGIRQYGIIIAHEEYVTIEEVRERVSNHPMFN